MEKKDHNEGKDKFIVSGNSGEVYYNKSSSTESTIKRGALGSCECQKCFEKKPFEQVRWEALTERFICFDCLAKTGSSQR